MRTRHAFAALTALTLGAMMLSALPAQAAPAHAQASAPQPAAASRTASSPSATPAPAAPPTLAEMNATHNHFMGSTIPANDPAAAPATRSFQAFSATTVPGVPGLDVSGWQQLSLSDWQAAWNNGARFAYVKATEGTDYTSSQFSEQYNDSYAVGMVRGAYHFAQPAESSGAVQANYFVDNGGGWSADGRTLPPLLDIEYGPAGDTCYGLSQSAMVSWIRDFSNTVLARTGRLPAIYSTTDWWTQCTGNNGSFGANPLFIARYPTNLASGAGVLPAGWSQYTMWQYADSGIYPGDQDTFQGTWSSLVAFATSGSTAADPPPATMQNPITGGCDLTGDGIPDLVARQPDGTLWLSAGLGGGSFASVVQIGQGWQDFNLIACAHGFTRSGQDGLIARKSDGTLWFYPGTGQGGLGTGEQIGTGWGAFSQIVVGGDFNGDGITDVLGIRPDGTLVRYTGTGSGTLSQTGTVIGTAWQQFTTVLAPGNLAGGSLGGLIGIQPDGTMQLYPQTSAGVLGAPTTIGTGWTIFNTVFAAGDSTGDGIPDLIGRKPDGTLWLYTGTGEFGSNTVGFAPPVQIGSGWGAFDQLVAADNFTGNGNADLIGRRPDGTLWLYPGNGAGATSPSGTQIGSGWDMFDTLLGADLTGDGVTDLIGREPDGTLWLYPGNGAGATSPSGTQIGSGWGVFDQLVAADNFTGTGNADLIGRKPDGTLWLYPGNGAGGLTPSGTQIGSAWNMFDTVLGADLTGDGITDLVGRKPDGTLWLYPGNGAGGLTPSGTQIGSGWDVFDAIVATDLTPGVADLIGRKPDGTLWLYASTLTPDPTLNPGSSVGSGWDVFG